MIAAVVDTHTVVWFLFNDRRLSNPARGFISRTAATGRVVGVSVISLAEVLYLAEGGRIPRNAFDLLLEMIVDPSEVLVQVRLDHAIVRDMQRIARKQVPDLPDRIIAATALHFGVPVISRDRKIQASGIETIW